MAETTWKVGEQVTGDGLGPRVMTRGARNTFVGVVKEIDPKETSDTGEELVLVSYTQPTTFDEAHGTKEGWHFAEELMTA